MLKAAILKGMPDKDLTQRYGGCYVIYDGNIVFVRDFSNPYILLNADGKDLIVPFDWERLDTARPRARWVIYNREKFGLRYCANVAYPPKRQYHRGLCGENIIVRFVDRSFNGHNLFHTILTQGFAPLDNKRLEIQEEGIFRDNMLVRRAPEDKDVFIIYYRTRNIGGYNVKDKRILLNTPRFRQEVEEAIVGIKDFDWEIEEPKMQINPPGFLYNPRAARPPEINPFAGNFDDDGERAFREARNMSYKVDKTLFEERKRAYERLLFDLNQEPNYA